MCDPAHRLAPPADPRRDPAAAAGVPHRARARAERGPAAQPRQDRHRRVAHARGRPRPPRGRALERALERRPRLAERLFTDGERAYAGRQEPPGDAPGRPLLREGGGGQGAGPRALELREVEVVAGDGPPSVRLSGRAAARAAGARGARRSSRSPTPRGSRPRWRSLAVSFCFPTGWIRCSRPSEMRAVDAWAIEERGRAVAGPDGARRRGPRPARRGGAPATGRSRVVCGKGNNGGDGLVAARLLREDGHEVDVLAAAAADELQRGRGDEPRAPAGRAAASRWTPRRLAGAGAIVDAMLGTGSRASRASPWPARSRRSTPRPRRWSACDVPSGVNASTGEVEGDAVRADRDRDVPRRRRSGSGSSRARRTPAGRGRRDRDAARRARPRRAGLIATRRARALPRRVARRLRSSLRQWWWWRAASPGSPARPPWPRGRPQRAGAGYVQVAVPGLGAARCWSCELLEAMTRGLPDEDGGHTAAGRGRPGASWPSAAARVVLGPGLGRSDGAVAFARGASRARRAAPLLVDADGLNAHAGALASSPGATRPRCSRRTRASWGGCSGSSREEVEAQRLDSAREAAARAAAPSCVLKGDDTIVAEPGGRVAVSRERTPGAGHRGHRRRAVRASSARCWPRASTPSRPRAPGVLRARAGRPRGRRPAGRRRVIAGDVIEALPVCAP